MSHFADYIKETRGRDIIETSYGFATYIIQGPECYIEDIYISPENRVNGMASKLADKIKERAKDAGCKTLIGTVNCEFSDPSTSMLSMLHYGFKILKACPGIIILTMEIK